jgi:Predicted membrane protein
MAGLIGWMGGTYAWVKALHVIVTVFWIAGLFMLPRYLAYQAAEAPGTAEDAKWVARTARLRRIILTPSLVLVWATGLAVAFHYGLASAGWIHAKITLALLLSGYHGWMTGLARRMAGGARPVPEKALRLWNEVPALFTILMVTLAVVKPF